MQTFSLHLSTDNAAFGGEDGFGPGYEVARILRDLAFRVETGLYPDEILRLRDTNGNRVGYAVLAAGELPATD